MAIEKNNFKVSRFDSELSPRSRESVSGEEDELQRRSSAAESDDDDEFNDADSGAGSDDFDLLELGETGAEFCQIENQTCSVPFELYDLPGLEDILSIDVWNECLTEEEKFSLTKFLPDIDQDTFMSTLKELFTGCNFHFGSPITKLFDMLKAGLCEPRVALYRQGMNFFQKRQHYHFLRKHQNSLVSNLCQIRDAWLSCRGYSIEEKLRVLNITKTQKSLMHEKMEDLESDSSEREESGEGLLSKRIKDRKVTQKMGRNPAYGVGSNMDFPMRGGSVGFEPEKCGKQNTKGILKMGGSKMPLMKEVLGGLPSAHHGLDMKPGIYGLPASLPCQNKAARYDSGAALRIRDQMRVDDGEDPIYGMGIQRDQNVSLGSLMDKSGIMKVGKKHERFRDEEFVTDSFMSVPLSSKNDLHAYGRKRNVNPLLDIKVMTAKPPNMRTPYEFAKKAKYAENVQQLAVGDQMKSLKGRAPYLSLKGTRVDPSDQAEPMWHNKTDGVAFSKDLTFKYNDWNIRSKKWKIGRDSPEMNFNSYRTSPHMNDGFLQNGGPDVPALKGGTVFIKSEETESDSSDQYDDDEDSNPLLRSKLAYPGDVMEGARPSLGKSGLDTKKTKVVKKDAKENARALDGITSSAKKMGDFADRVHVRGIENYSSKGKHKSKMHDGSPLRNSVARVFDSNLPQLGKVNEDDDDDDVDDDDDRKQIFKLDKNGQMLRNPGERSHQSYLKAYPAERGERGKAVPRSDYLHDYVDDKEDNSLETRLFADGNGKRRSGKKGQSIEAYLNTRHEKSEAPLLGCNSVAKKRKGKEDMAGWDGQDADGYLRPDQQQIDDSTSLKKRGKRKLDDDGSTSDIETFEPPVTEMEAADVELETRLQKKPFTLITPTVHTGFSFSIIHLLSAVRMAMITLLPEDSLEVGKSVEEQNRMHESVNNGILLHENMDVNNSVNAGQGNVPSHTVQEIVNRVRSNPGDPCILETQEPLQDLVRGVLKIFSSRTAPLGAKSWKALVVYEKPTKSWSWVGPVSHSSENETIEEVTSPEAWGLPHKMLVKLVDSFANWLKISQKTLQEIGSLPAPPASLIQFNKDEKERFRDLRAQKSLNTISPSSDEARAYFRKEEVLRYSIPDRAFSYTAADGKKSIVAPLRRCGGKPTSKAREHFMLKRDRPPHVTILCLVRDAAARLPGSIGTRADVCTLIRDSQYVVEDVSDAQVNQVVSGALDRLHYERDPCVQYDGERKLWVYLHRQREEEDFEDDGTSSTKKWKRPKKDAAEQSDQASVTVAYHGSGDQTGFDVCSDPNAEASGIDDDKRTDPAHDDVRHDVEDNVDTSHGPEQENMHQGHPMVVEALGLNSMRENKLLCQENSTNEDFDDETYGRERPVGLLSASLL